MIRAIAVAASSLLKFVLSPSFIMVSVNVNKLSVPRTPSCPAISITAAICEALCGILSDISVMPCASSAYSSFVASTVLRTPVKALSKSDADLTAAVSPPTIGTVNVFVAVAPMEVITPPAACILSPNFAESDCIVCIALLNLPTPASNPFVSKSK